MAKEIKIGTEVWIIERDLNIVNKKIVAIVDEGDEIKYKIDVKSCGGITKNDFCLTKQKAQVKKKNFLDELRFRIGDLVVFEYKEYSNRRKTIGRITAIRYSGNSYEVSGSYKEFNNISDEDILLKIKNEFIENWGNLEELYEQFNEKDKEIRGIITMIHKEHERLEKELEQNIRKQYSVFNWNKSKPLFKDRFSYTEDFN